MNTQIFNFLHSLLYQYEWLDAIVWFCAVPLVYIMILVVSAHLFWHYKIFSTKNQDMLLRHKGKEVVRVLFSSGLAYLLAKFLKYIIHTDRPFIALSNVYPMFFESGYAFPSGHASAISALAFAIYFKHKKLGYLCFVSAILVGLSRIITGVHFPIDILGGFVLGFLVAFLVKRL